ncbi:MAG: NAD-dependent malic enzyme [Aeromicrobium sp.]
MGSVSISNSIVVRLTLPAGGMAVSDLTAAVERAGGQVTALDVSSSTPETLQVDLTVSSSGPEHADRLVASLREIEHVEVVKVSDRTFLMHLGGVIETRSKHPLRNRDDLSMVYTPGVARICQAIVDDPEDARRLTIKRNSVAVVTDGSAVLGLGNIGPRAALPVMEGKAALFKAFADIDAWPLCLDTQDVEQIIETVAAVAPGFAGINLEDISAPRCFEIEQRLRDRLDIPVFHDDQHGTAVVVLAALRNALRVVGKTLPTARIVLVGAGAAGTAVLKVLLHAGAREVLVCDVEGVVHVGRPGLHESLVWTAENTNRAGVTGSLRAALPGADVFIGVSAPGLIDADDVQAMADDAIVFALANPDPEIEPSVARRHAAVVATGRSDHPNQINNVLAFPGIFRGLLDARSRGIGMDVLTAAADAIADSVSADELGPNYIIPSVFHAEVHHKVAAAVHEASASTRVRP